MKKSLAAIILILTLFIFAGCGQQMPVTVYNAIPIFGAQQIAVDANTGSNDQWFAPTTNSLNSDGCNSTNSVTFNTTENDKLSVGASGYIYVDSTDTSVTAFYLTPTAQVVYADFLSTPHWYAEVNLGSVIFYKK
jgi:hypothetical protein